MSPFPTVKTSPYGLRKPSRGNHLWPESRWRSSVLKALWSLPPQRREVIAALVSFRFNRSTLFPMEAA